MGHPCRFDYGSKQKSPYEYDIDCYKGFEKAGEYAEHPVKAAQAYRREKSLHDFADEGDDKSYDQPNKDYCYELGHRFVYAKKGINETSKFTGELEGDIKRAEKTCKGQYLPDKTSEAAADHKIAAKDDENEVYHVPANKVQLSDPLSLSVSLIESILHLMSSSS